MRLRIVKYMSFLLCVGITAFSGAQIACAQDFLSLDKIKFSSIFLNIINYRTRFRAIKHFVLNLRKL